MALVAIGLAVSAGADVPAGISQQSQPPTRPPPNRITPTPTIAPIRPLLSEPVGLTLATVGPIGVTLIDLDTGAETARMLGAEAPIAVGNALVVTSRGRAYSASSTATRASLDLGRADAVFRSDHGGRVWLVSFESGGRMRVREVDLTGRPTGSDRYVAGSVVAAAGTGLVIAQHEAHFLLERDGSSRLLFHGSLVGAGGGKIAYRACVALDDCGLHVLDVTRSDDRAIEFPRRPQLNSFTLVPWAPGSFSPDGARLAVLLPSPASYLAVIDVGSGETVFQVAVPVEAGPLNVAWSPDGARLFWAAGSSLAGTWRTGTAEAERVVLPDQPPWWGLAVLRTTPATGATGATAG